MPKATQKRVPGREFEEKKQNEECRKLQLLERISAAKAANAEAKSETYKMSLTYRISLTFSLGYRSTKTTTTITTRNGLAWPLFGGVSFRFFILGLTWLS
jgi:hypothetical protein